MEKAAVNKRKNYFIKKKFQTGFIIKFSLLAIAGSAVSGLIIYLLSRNTVTTAFVNSRLTIKSTADFILPAVLLSCVAVVIVIGLAAIGLTLFVSHKIAGPLYRIEKDIEEVAACNLNVRFGLRKTDELKAMAACLDKMVQNLRSDMVLLKEAASELDLHAPQELRPHVHKIKQVVDKFRI
jgi:methyl-accepting chemotaxis protein